MKDTSSIMVGPPSSRGGGITNRNQKHQQYRRGVLGFDIFSLEATLREDDQSVHDDSIIYQDMELTEDDDDLHEHPTYFAHPGSLTEVDDDDDDDDTPNLSKNRFFPAPGLTWSNSPLSSTRMFGGGAATLDTQIPSIMSGNNNRLWSTGTAAIPTSTRNGRSMTSTSTTTAATAAAATAMSMSSSSLQYTLPAWFPWMPTKSQILSLKVIELREACSQRGLLKTGNKQTLQERLWSWTTNQQQQHQARITSGDFLTNWFEDMAFNKAAATLIPPKARPSIKNKDNTSSSSTISQGFSSTTTIKESKTPNSLEEWSRSVDLEKLMNKRQEIHRQKRQGRKPDKVRPNNNNKDKASQKDTIASTKDYLLSLTKAMQASPSSPYASNREVKELYKASKQADQLGERTLSIQLLESLLEITPNDARSFRRLSRMYVEQGELDVARATLQKGLRRLPDNPWLWHGLGQLELAHGQTDLGIKYFQRAITEDPTFAHSYHAWGIHEYYQGHIAQAMKILKKGIEYCPTNHRLHHALGDLYRGAKLLKDAERSYRRALEEGPPVSHGFAYSALARVAYEQGDIDEARRWLYKSIHLNDGRHAQGWLALAEMEEAEGNFQKALAVCQGSIIQYEKGLIESRQRYKKERDNDRKRLEGEGNVNFMERPQRQDKRSVASTISFDTMMANPEDIKNSLLKSVPAYRSGDKFLNVFRHWARLEERYGSFESTNRAYERASLAFPLNYKITLDWAQYHSTLRTEDRARRLFIEACTKAGSHHADPYRLFASFEIALGNYQQARKIMFRGAQTVAQSSDGGLGNRRGLGKLFVTWAMCEWHQKNIPRAENLFDHALRLTEAGDEGSELRSFILYCMARLEYYERGEVYLAQHCIGLCLKENSLPGGNARVWQLWAEIAANEFDNPRLEEECWSQFDKCNSVYTNGPPSSLEEVLKQGELESWMRQEPWHEKLQEVRRVGEREEADPSKLSDDTTTSYFRDNNDDFYSTIRFPVSSRKRMIRPQLEDANEIIEQSLRETVQE